MTYDIRWLYLWGVIVCVIVLAYLWRWYFDFKKSPTTKKEDDLE